MKPVIFQNSGCWRWTSCFLVLFIFCTIAQAQVKSDNGARRPLAIGFFVNWDKTSLVSLKRNLNSLDMVIGEWLHLANEDGSIRENDTNRQTQVTDYIRSLYPFFPIVPLVNNWNGHEWDGGGLGRMLADPTARARNIEQLAAYVDRNRFTGLSIDYENIATGDRLNFQCYIKELSATLHSKNVFVTVTVPATDPGFPYKELAEHADALILMVYDEHWADGAPGPIASQHWFRQVLDQRKCDIPANKMIVGVGNYVYDWVEGRPADVRTFAEVVQIAKESRKEINLNPVSLNPTFDYIDRDQRSHQVWFLDAVTVFNQLKASTPIQPYGVALWRLGGEDPSLWQVFGKKEPLDAARADRLTDMETGTDVEHNGRGEIPANATRQRSTIRNIKYDQKVGLITEERLLAH